MPNASVILGTDFGRIANAMQKLGSGRMWIRIVEDDGTVITGEDFVPFPIVKDSTLKDDFAEEFAEDEGGDQYPQEGKRTVELSGTTAQRDKATLEVSTKTLRGKYVAILKEQSSRPVNGKYQYLYVALAKMTPNLEVKFPGGEIGWKFNPQPAPSAVSIDLSTLGITDAKVTLTGTVAIPVGEYYAFHEQAAS
jgi:hypothetical protein